MKDQISNITSSILRYILAAFAGWVSVQSGYELLTGDPGGMTLLQFVSGIVVVGVTVALKFASGTKYGAIANLIVGPRVINIAHSIARTAIAVLAGGITAALGADATASLDPDLGENSVVGLVVLLGGLIIDRVSKKFKP